MWFRKDPNSCRRLQSVRLPWSIRAMSKPKIKWSPWLMTSATQNNPMKLSEREVNACCYQPPPQALRFLHGRGERETRVTGDEPQGTMGRVQTAGEAPSRPLSPSFARTSKERRLGTRQCCYRKARENASVLVSDCFKKSARFESWLPSVPV